MDGSSCQLNELRGKIEKLIVWRSGTNRAPHKPLQLLMAVANAQCGKPRLQPFAEIEPNLRTALETFGPVRKSVHPEYPFWHLQTDKIWQIVSDGEVKLRAKSLNPTAKALRDKNAKGGLLPFYHDALAGSPTLQMDVIHDILDNHFPSSIHEEIINFFGLIVRQGENKPNQSAKLFRQEVLTAYDGACAISNFAVRLHDSLIGVEATHLMWPQAGGLNSVTNAIAMTTLHRKLFHLGVFTLDTNYRVRISTKVSGTSGYQDMLGQFEGKKISLPANSSINPSQESLAWHRDQVFRH